MNSITNTNEISQVLSFDFRYDPTPKSSIPKLRIRDGEVVKRTPSSVNGIVLHQTAIKYGVTSRQVEEANGNKQLAVARRAKRIACHACSFEGFYAKAYPLDFYINQANALNANTLGLEIEGRFPGLMDNPDTFAREDLKTLWKGEPTELTYDRIKAACAALAYLVQEGHSLGMPIKYLYAHRQAKLNRRSDPGEELWREVALEYGVAVLGLETRPLFTIGTGRPIPIEWDSRGGGPY
jgi:hypothetical protein